jgi:hypothetical protein
LKKEQVVKSAEDIVKRNAFLSKPTEERRSSPVSSKKKEIVQSIADEESYSVSYGTQVY